MQKPNKKTYGWYESSGLEDETTGWQFEGGEEAYEEAMENYTILVDIKLENLAFYLMESIADFLDTDRAMIEETILNIKDPVPYEKSELHTRMANAAMVEYKKTMFGI